MNSPKPSEILKPLCIEYAEKYDRHYGQPSFLREAINKIRDAEQVILDTHAATLDTLKAEHAELKREVGRVVEYVTDESKYTVEHAGSFAESGVDSARRFLAAEAKGGEPSADTTDAEAKLIAAERDRDEWKAKCERLETYFTSWCHDCDITQEHATEAECDAAVRAHDLICPSHPMRQIEAKLAAVTGERDAAMRVIEAQDSLWDAVETREHCCQRECGCDEKVEAAEKLVALAKLALSGGKVGA